MLFGGGVALAHAWVAVAVMRWSGSAESRMIAMNANSPGRLRSACCRADRDLHGVALACARHKDGDTFTGAG